MSAWLARSVLLIYLINLSSSPAELRTGNVKTAKDRNLISKRGLAEFGLMIHCATGRNPFDFYGYGCWCGIGGEGEPVDDLDRCCQAHDNCYKNIRTSGICPIDASIYIMPYSRTGCTSCEPMSYYLFFGRCRNALCECDATAARCFATTPYNQAFEDYKGKCE